MLIKICTFCPGEQFAIEHPQQSRCGFGGMLLAQPLKKKQEYLRLQVVFENRC
jgi:hypothetical protein